jgi:hypothetical protein
MLHDLLRQYLEEVELSIQRLQIAYIECYHEEILTPGRAKPENPHSFL